MEGEVADPEIPDGPKGVKALKSELWRQDWINRKYQAKPEDHSQVLTFNAGLEFIATNRNQDNWFLQIETFDPHEPFYSFLSTRLTTRTSGTVAISTGPTTPG